MRRIALGLMATGLLATNAWADERQPAALRLDSALRGVTFGAVPARTATPQAAADEAPKVSGIVGVDFPSSYFFRGFRQETDPALTLQPFVDVAIPGESASFNIGLWNSMHTGSLKDGDAGWYETDFYLAATMGRIKATYTAYLYPKIDDSAIHEVMLSTTFDHKLAPSAAIAFEISKASGADKGIYFELGIAPAIPMADDAPVTVTVPIKIGLSLKDYYGEDTFGYVSGGLTIGRSISDNVEVHGGVTVYGFGEALKFYNNDKAGQFIGSFGLSMSF